MRFGYTLEAPGSEGPIASHEVDPTTVDSETLREELDNWAVTELRSAGCEFGLYIAEFSSWYDTGEPAYFLRASYLIWNSEELITAYHEDSAINFPGIRALTAQAQACDQLLTWS